MTIRWFAVLSTVVSVAAVACGSGEKKQDEKVLADLVSCKEERSLSQNQLKSCVKEFADLRNGPDAGPTSDGEEFVVRYDGELLTIVGHTKNGQRVPTGTGGELSEAEQKVTESVTSQIRGSKNAIQACYVQALKTNTDLENRSITLDIKVVVSPSGKISNPSMQHLSPQFDACMKTVAGRWKITAYQGKGFPIVVPIKLQPAP